MHKGQIYIAPKQEKHLAQEVWHFVQQKKGKVAQSTKASNAAAVNDDTSLEKEAQSRSKEDALHNIYSSSHQTWIMSTHDKM